MPWPKGMPRNGHVKASKERTLKQYTCAECGDTFTRGRGRPPAVALCPLHGGKATRSTESEARTITVRKVSADMVPAENPNHPTIRGAAVGASGRPSTAITEPCPNCAYAYADGGYCPDCGWSKPITRLPYGAATGPTKRK